MIFKLYLIHCMNWTWYSDSYINRDIYYYQGKFHDQNKHSSIETCYFYHVDLINVCIVQNLKGHMERQILSTDILFVQKIYIESYIYDETDRHLLF